MAITPPRGSWAARFIWWPLLRGMVTLGMTLTGIFVSIFGVLTALRRLFWSVPIVGALSDIVFLPLYVLLFLLYGIVFIGLAVVSLFAIRQGLQSARPEFLRPTPKPPSAGAPQQVDVKVSDVE